MNLFPADTQAVIAPKSGIRTITCDLYILSARLCASVRNIFNFFLVIFFAFFIVSCARSSAGGTAAAPSVSDTPPVYVTWTGARPAAILRTGEYPLIFQLTEEGPVHIEAIEDAVSAAGFMPWPYALHIRFLQKREDGLVMLINRSGFLKIAPNGNDAPGFAMYLFSGEEFRQYTAGGLVFFDDKPAALLYTDNHFTENAFPQPRQRTWSFNMDANVIFPIDVPVLKFFPEEDGWEADTLRYGNDGLIYYRTAKRSASSSSVRMFRTNDLTRQGEEIPIEVFYKSAPGRVDNPHPSLPPLPEGFFYTETGETGDSVFASWEEQQDYSIGAAGFMIIKF